MHNNTLSDWDSRFSQILTIQFHKDIAKRLEEKYLNAFPVDFKYKHSPEDAVIDVGHLETLSDSNKIIYSLTQKNNPQKNDPQYLRLFSLEGKLSLSTVMPQIENLGFIVHEEQYYALENNLKKSIHVYLIESRSNQLNFSEAKQLVEEALYAISSNKTTSDYLTKLTSYQQISWRDLDLIRTLAAYAHQVSILYDHFYINKTLVTYSVFAKKIVELFYLKFSPIAQDEEKYKSLHESLSQDLMNVSSSSEDKVLRAIFGSIDAAVRTNFFQLSDTGDFKSYISIKFDSSKVPDMPRPVPYAEIFVYARDFEGVHLRGGKVARGGIRWSDRGEDYRTEVLGLMKAQMTKNTVIVPVGSKGGFCVRISSEGLTKSEYMSKVIESYQNFLRGLLDITDNIIDGNIHHPKNTILHDTEDPYLVVAADKGTATFSDYANQVSAEYNFWLSDAFASGGSRGYDHKKIGITAKGGWISVQRHFKEMCIDPQKNEITVVGIGDMSGDVFGNAMILSSKIKLVAAFNHIHIFIDPNPDASKSFLERKRLFEMPGSKWSDYNKDIISSGGGVYDRSAKLISLSAEVRSLLGIQKQEIEPNELIKAILKIKVDLLWNGGIGTYIKSVSEENYKIGDKANDAVRVDGQDILAKVIGEGGNLGVSQKGRIEYAMRGGRINTDFIDNSAGVDCSDHEVNIKIALDKAIAKGALTLNERNLLLAEMTEDVASLVLEDNINQTLAISIMEKSSLFSLEAFAILIDHLEKTASLDRGLEFIPTNQELIARSNLGSKLTRPELSVILSYSKRSIYDELDGSKIAGQEYFTKWLIEYFPALMQQKFKKEILEHPLRKEIILTIITNKLANRLSAPVINSIKLETGCEICDIARGFVIVQEIFDLESLWKEIENLPSSVPIATIIEIYTYINKVNRRGVAWMISNTPSPLGIEESVSQYKTSVLNISEMLTKNLQGPAKDRYEAKYAKYFGAGINADLAEKCATLDSLVSSFDISMMSAETNQDPEIICKSYFLVADLFHLDFLRKLCDKLMTDSYWQKLSLQSIKDDLYYKQRLIVRLIAEDKMLHDVDKWYRLHLKFSSSYNNFIESLKIQENIDTSMLILANKKLDVFIRKQ
ncbi:MAG: hypothetical protein EB127_04615 [Alphaproteobacteria bacterium]|nr:hypothetical protein [Alphaproteobacteria bacterium]